MSARTRSRPFQFRVRTALVLMLVFGVGGGLWMRRERRRSELLRLRMEVVKRLQPTVDFQTAVSSAILDRFAARSELGHEGAGAMQYRTGSTHRGSVLGLEWDMTLQFVSGRTHLIRINVGGAVTPEGPEPILIRTDAMPEFEDLEHRCVQELRTAFAENGWESEEVSRERWVSRRLLLQQKMEGVTE